MEERRRFVRLNARADVAYVVLPSGTTQHAVSKDVSGGGARLATDRPFLPGTQLQMAIRLPGVDEPINAIMEVVWSEQSEVVGKTDRQRSVESGAKCLEIAPKDQEAVTTFVSGSLGATGSASPQ